MISSENYMYERALGLSDDGGTGSDMRRYVVWNNKEKQEERYHTAMIARKRLDDLNEERGGLSF